MDGDTHTRTVALGGVRLQPLGPSSHLMEGPLSLVARGCRPGVWAEPREKAKVVLTSCGYRSLCSCLRKSSALSDPTSSSKAIFSSCGRHRTQPSGRPPRLAVPEDREPTGSARAFLGRGRVKTVWPDGPPLGQAVDAPGPGGLCPLEGARAAGTRATRRTASLALRLRGRTSRALTANRPRARLCLRITLQTQARRSEPGRKRGRPGGWRGTRTDGTSERTVAPRKFRNHKCHG